MGVSIVTQLEPTSADATFDFVGSLDGETPVCAIFQFGKTETINTSEDGMSFGNGFTDGINQACTAVASKFNVVTSDTGIQSKSDKCIMRLDPADHTIILAEAQIVSMSANTVRVNFTTANATAHLVSCIMISGVEAAVGLESLPGTVDTTGSVTGLSFKPNFVLTTSQDSTIPSSAIQGPISFGMATYNGSTINQGLVSSYSRTLVSTSSINGVNDDRYFCGNNKFNGGLKHAQEMASFNADGFTYTQRILAATASQNMAYLAIKVPNDTVNLIKTSHPASTTGNNSVTGIGFEPQAIFNMSVWVSTYNINQTDGDVSGQHLSFFNATEAVTHHGVDQDNVGTTNNETGVHDDPVYLVADDGTLSKQATFVSMDADGYTLNYTTAVSEANAGFSVGMIIPPVSVDGLKPGPFALAPFQTSPFQIGAWR